MSTKGEQNGKPNKTDCRHGSRNNTITPYPRRHVYVSEPLPSMDTVKKKASKQTRQLSINKY